MHAVRHQRLHRLDWQHLGLAVPLPGELLRRPDRLLPLYEPRGEVYKLASFETQLIAAVNVGGIHVGSALTACVTCPDNSYCPPTSLTGCICLAGYTGNDNDNCTGVPCSMD